MSVLDTFTLAALEVPDEEWLDVFETNVHGRWRMSQTAGRHSVDQGRFTRWWRAR